MTIAQSIIVSASAEMREAETTERKRKGLLKELKEMSRTMIEEQGLINHAQAALILEISTRRVGELVETGKLRPFEFLGRKYVSVREVHARWGEDIKAGRPPLTTLGKVKLGVKLLGNADIPNMAIGMATVDEVEAKRKKRLGKTSKK